MRPRLGTSSTRVAAALAAALALPACGDGEQRGSGGAGRIQVVASFYPVAEAAARVGGPRAEVTNLTPAGAEPHDIELTPSQVDRLEDADVVVYLGHGFQPAVEEIAERRQSGSVDLLDVLGLDDPAGASGEGGDGGHDHPAVDGDELDPHFWLNPRLMARAATAVSAALAGASPADAGLFEANAGRYREDLDALDREFAAGLKACDRKEIVTAHAAFSYLAERYGLTQLAIAGLSPETEPDADRLARLTDQIAAKGITTVFYEELVAPTVAETLAREAGVATAVLNPIEGLTQDQIAAGKDYAAVMRDNLAALRAALGCR